MRPSMRIAYIVLLTFLVASTLLASPGFSDTIYVVGGPYSGTTQVGSPTLSSITWQQTIQSSDNRLLIVVVASPLGTVSGVTFNGTALTWKSNTVNDGVEPSYNATGVAVSVWYLVNPPVGTYDIVASFSGSVAAAGGIGAQYRNVHQTTPLGSVFNDPGQAGPPATSIDVYVYDTVLTGSPNVRRGMVIDAVGAEALATPSWSVGSGQTQRGSESIGNGIKLSLSEKPSTGSTVIMSGSSSAQSALCNLGIEVRPVD